VPDTLELGLLMGIADNFSDEISLYSYYSFLIRKSGKTT